jgi:hypothetical protein
MSHIFACFCKQWHGSGHHQHPTTTVRRAVSGIASLLGDIDRLCGQLATALHDLEPQIYATLAVIAVLSFVLFPPKDGPDQV